MDHTTVIKRHGSRDNEHYTHDKLRSSVHAACLSVRSPEGEAESIAEHVATIVSDWCSSRAAVTSDDLRRVAGKCLDLFHPEAAYLYQNHEMVV